MSIRHALLALLSEGPRYGLQLRQEFEERTGDVWPLNVGQVYTTLQRLERDGLVRVDEAGDDDRQKCFRITSDGATELAAWHPPRRRASRAAAGLGRATRARWRPVGRSDTVRGAVERVQRRPRGSLRCRSMRPVCSHGRATLGAGR